MLMPTQRRTDPPSRASTRIIGFAALGIALILLGAGYLFSIASGTSRHLDALVVTPAPIPWRQKPAPMLILPTIPTTSDVPAGPVTILLLGNDRRPGEEATPRADAIMVVRYDPDRRRVSILSLPRDLWVAIPGYGENRLNTAYLRGEYDGSPGTGMALAKATVSDLLGIPISYVAVVDFRGFIGIIDALDGVTVDVSATLVDDHFPTADHGFTTVRFAPGLQSMDGATALTYCRVRHPDDDFARHRRQQAVLLAIAARLRERGVGNLLAAEHLSGALVGFVQTDMPRDQIINLALSMHNLDLSAIERYFLTTDDVTFGVDNDRYALLPHPGVISSLTQHLLGALP